MDKDSAVMLSTSGLSVGFSVCWIVFRAIPGLVGTLIGSICGGLIAGQFMGIVINTAITKSPLKLGEMIRSMGGWVISFLCGGGSIYLVNILINRMSSSVILYIISFVIGCTVIGIGGKHVMQFQLSRYAETKTNKTIEGKQSYWIWYFIFGSVCGIVLTLLLINLAARVVSGDTIKLMSIIFYGIGGAIAGAIGGRQLGKVFI